MNTPNNFKLHKGQIDYIDRVLEEAASDKHNAYERAAFIKIVDDLINEHLLTKFTRFEGPHAEMFMSDIQSLKTKLYQVSESVAGLIGLIRENSWDISIKKFMKKEVDSKSAVYTIDVPTMSSLRDRVKSGELFAISFVSKTRKHADMIRITKLNDIQPYITRARVKKSTQMFYVPKYLLRKNVWDKSMLVLAKLTYGEGSNVILEYQIPIQKSDEQTDVVKNAFKDNIVSKMNVSENIIDIESQLMDLSTHKIPSHIGRRTKPTSVTPMIVPTIPNILKDDIMLTMPHHSYDHVLNFIRDCVYDQDVTEMYQTLYRVSSVDTSPILEYLCYAASIGKSVNVIVEGRASGEIKKNKAVYDKLVGAGVKVFYKEPKDASPKVHAKFLVVRTIKNGVLTYVSTGNFNEDTSKVYLDYGYFTHNQEIGNHLIEMFNHVIEDNVYEDQIADVDTSDVLLWRMNSIKARLLEEINTITNIGEGEIILKTNELSDSDIIEALELAARKDISITVYCRGACLLPLTKNVTVSSIIGKYLEHSRFYIFKTKQSPNSKYFISTADLSRKKLVERYEFLLDISDHPNAVFSVEAMSRMIRMDTVNKWVVGKDGKYVRSKNHAGIKFNSHKNVTIL